MQKRILVTGANGHVGQACVRDLLQNGYNVRASVRDIKNAEKTAGLSDLGIDIVEADLFDQASLDRACDGCDSVFQLAAIYEFFGNTDQSIFEKTGTGGASNLLKAAAKANIKRVVLTSSIVAVGPTERGMPPATEEHWNTDLQVPYFREKTDGERFARKVAGQIGIDLVTVCPGVVLGPYFQKSTPSIDNIEAIAKGALLFGVPNVSLATVDVRDVASAHRLAFEKGAPGGRYIAIEGNYSMRVIAERLHDIDPDVKRPLMTMPSFIQPLLPLFDLMNSKILGHPRTISRELEKSLRGRDLIFNNTASRNALMWQPHYGLLDSLSETLNTLRQNGRYGR